MSTILKIYFEKFFESLRGYSNFVEEEQKDTLMNSFVSGLEILYASLSTIVLKPFFTFLFFLFIATTAILVALSLKNYLNLNFVAAIKFLVASLISIILSLDVYLIAFGKSTILLFYIQFQKDLLFILISCFIGIISGKVFFKKKEREVLP